MIVFYHSIWQQSDHTHDHHKVGSLFWKRTLQKSKALATLKHFFKYPFLSQTKKAKYLPMLALSFCFQLSTLLRFRMKAHHFLTYFFVILRFHLSTLRNNKFSKRFTLNTVVKSLISSAFFRRLVWTIEENASEYAFPSARTALGECWLKVLITQKWHSKVHA